MAQPTDQKKRNASKAETGLELHCEDPTVNELESVAENRVGMEAALYLPSGSMGNQIAARVHAESGQEVLLEEECHIFEKERGTRRIVRFASPSTAGRR